MIRIQKLIAQAGIASRRKAEELIEQGKVRVNGKVATLGDKATFKDDIKINGKSIGEKEQKAYYIVNKPTRVITSLRDPEGRPIITDVVQVKERIFPVGRLDYETTGVLLMTNDGELAHRLAHPSYEVLRVYRARITRSLTAEELKTLNGDGIIINDKPSKQKVTRADTKTYIVTLHQGTYHHVKLLFEEFDTEVLSLTRIEYAGLNARGLSKGEFRRLNVKEVRWLKQLVKLID